MKSSFKHNSKKMKSLDSKQTLKLKNALSKKKITQSVVYKPNEKKNILREIENHSIKEKDEISLLSNANLNIIKILNSCANEDILNDSSFIVSNSNDDIKDRSLESINKWQKRICQFKPSPKQKFKKRIKRKPNSINSNSNISNFLLNSNISDFSSESIFSDKKHNNNNSTKRSNFHPHNNDKDGSIDEIHFKSNLKEPLERYKSDVDSLSFKNKVKKPIVRHISDINMKKKLRKSSKKQLEYISDFNLNKILNEKNKIRRDSSDVEIELNKFDIKNPKVRHSIEFNNKKKEKVAPRKRSRSIVFNDKNLLFNNLNNVPNPNIAVDKEIEDSENYKGFLNEIEIMKINENIHNDINFIQLKRRISRLKKTIQNKNNSDINKHKKSSNTQSNNNTNSNNNNNLNNSKNKIHTIIENNNEDTTSIKNSDNTLKNLESKNNDNQSLSSNLNSKKKLLIQKDKFRVIIRRKEIYDSMDDEEYKEEVIDFYINPDSWYVKIFDSFLFLASLFYFMCVPYYLSRNYFIVLESRSIRAIFLIIDITYILDVIINFFRAYQNYEEHLIRKTKRIILHYIKTWFILDFTEAIPYYSILKFIEKNISQNDKSHLKLDGHHFINPKLYILLLIKIIKAYKMFNKNSTIKYYSEILSRSETFDDHGDILTTFFITIFILNLTTCLFIFLGINSHSGWIINLDIQDESYLNIYLTSVYFVIVTITTVGYGDITGKTIPEIGFQIYLLIIGTIAYSFTISYISNYIIKSNKKSMTFEKHLEILQEIKIHHPNMKNSLYNEILRNIYNEQLYERKDKHLLFDCLPYSLKNKLIVEMYKPLIKTLVFFKDIDNSDFIVKVVTSLKPLISVKGDIVIEEGDYIKEIIFVKKGVIGLNICINLEDPEFSLKKYFGNNKIGKFDITYIKSNIVVPKKSFEEAALNNLFNKSEETIIYKNDNFEDIKIIEIRKNEHFGDALMFLNERCPLVAKVRTKTAELLILRKIEAIEIYSIYPNIWKRINKKSLFNMEQIYHKIKKVVIELSNRYKVNIETCITRKKTKSKKISNNNINEEEENNVDEDEDDSEKKEMENNKPKEKVEIKEFIQEQPQKIIEFNENMNNINNNISINLNASITNMIENITFLKKNSSLKDTILSLAANDLLKKNSVFKNSLLSNSNRLNRSKRSIKSKKSNKSKISNRSLRSNRSIRSNKSKRLKMSKTKTTTRELKRNNRKSNPIFSKTLVKFNTSNSFNSKNNGGNNNEKKNNYYKKKHSSIFPNVCLTNNSKMSDTNNSDSSINIRSSFRQSKTKKEKIFYSSFTNLTTTQENTFQLNSSYDNINKISNNKYIKDINLQTKIRQILMNECIEGNFIKKKNTFLQLPGMSKNLNSYSLLKSSNKASSRELPNLSEVEFEDLSQCPSQRTIVEERDAVSKDTTTIINKSDNSEGNSKIKKDAMCSSGKLLELRRPNKMVSSKSIFDMKKVRTPMLEARKPIKKKKKAEKINKQLNIISKNIETTSRNINNPGEFYMNFFNNIIAQENKSVNGDDDSKKNNILNAYAGSKMKDSKISEHSNISQNILDSFIPYKEEKSKDGNISNSNSNLNLKLEVSIKKSKTKQKSSFK